MDWILILLLLNPQGEYVAKVPVPYPSQALCRQALQQLKKPVEIDAAQPLKAGAWTCVSRAHWEGRAVDKGTALD